MRAKIGSLGSFGSFMFAGCAYVGSKKKALSTWGPALVNRAKRELIWAAERPLPWCIVQRHGECWPLLGTELSCIAGGYLENVFILCHTVLSSSVLAKQLLMKCCLLSKQAFGLAHLHAVEAGEVVQLEVLDDGQEQQEEDDERRKLAAVVDVHEGLCTQRVSTTRMTALRTYGRFIADLAMYPVLWPEGYI